MNEPTEIVVEAATSLNRALDITNERDQFGLSSGIVLSGYVPLHSFEALSRDYRKAILKQIAELVREHERVQLCSEKPNAFTGLGIEVGAGALKLLMKTWSKGHDDTFEGKLICDVKFQLPKIGSEEDTGSYVEAVQSLLEVFASDESASFGDRWIVPPGNFEIDEPSKLLRDWPRSKPFVYVYGTQGPRNVTKNLGRNPFSELYVLSGDDEGSIIGEVMVPDSKKSRAGVMAIEIGSGSTELILNAGGTKRYPITFSIGGNDTRGLRLVSESLDQGDILESVIGFLESPIEVGKKFFDELLELRGVNLHRLVVFMNPNKDSLKFRELASKQGGSPPGSFTPNFAQRYGSEATDDKFHFKAKILGSVGNALGVDLIFEGVPGGLKEGFAIFIETALQKVDHGLQV